MQLFKNDQQLINLLQRLNGRRALYNRLGYGTLMHVSIHMMILLLPAVLAVPAILNLGA